MSEKLWRSTNSTSARDMCKVRLIVFLQVKNQMLRGHFDMLEQEHVAVMGVQRG